MAFQIVKEQDWIVNDPSGQPVDGVRVTVQDLETGETFNVEVAGKTQPLIKQAVEARIAARRESFGSTFE